jgi:DNA polymerase-4
VRWILHVDMDAFFAAVEVVRHPEYRGKPLIVGGNKEDLRGVVATASYEARTFGVHSAMSLAEARRRCPHAIFIRGNHALYAAVSKQVRQILETFSSKVEMASIDEAYLDISGSLHLFGDSPLSLARQLKQQIRAQLELPCTVAVAANKLVAKIASDRAKPDGLRIVPPGEEAAFLAPLPLKQLPGAGPKTCEQLQRLGLNTLGDLVAAPLSLLERAMPPAAAMALQRRAAGRHFGEVVPLRLPKQISKETTFSQDTSDWASIEQTLFQLADRCLIALRKRAMETRRVTLKVRYADFETKTFAQALAQPTAVDAEVYAVLHALIPKARARRGRVRLIGVALGELACGQHQLSLFENTPTERWDRLLRQVDALRDKHGPNAVHLGRVLGGPPEDPG